MISIAICDDEEEFLEKTEKLITDFNRDHPDEVNFRVSKYAHPKLLSDDVLDGAIFDVFLLDMEMEELDGVTLAERIREKIPSCVIVFISCHTEFRFTQEGYRVQALRYISKLTMETALPELLEAAVRACKRSASTYYVLTHYSENIRIPLDELIYVRRVKRMAVFTTEDQKRGELSIKRPLKDIFNEINDRRFVFVDRSCFVNMDHITRITEAGVVLRSGEAVPVSRKMMPVVKSGLLRLWGGINA